MEPWRVKQALTLVILLLLTPLSLTIKDFETTDLIEEEGPSFTSVVPWNPQTQPWAQYSGMPTHNGSMPPHGPDGGPGLGSVEDVIQFGVIDSPTVNWVASDDFDGADAYGSIIGDFSASVTTTPGSIERCGLGELFGIIITSESGSSTLSIITGDEAKIAWQVDLGQTDTIRSTPMITDIDSDGKQEVIVVYDTASSLEIEVWSPELSCSESGWVKSGHENEKVWSFSDSDYSIGIESPHFPTSQSNHKSVTQPLLADLDLDGDAELVLALVDKNSDNPTVTALTLTTSTPNDFDWEVVLDRGTHPSDPSWGMLDDDSTAIVLTTIDSNSGNMWIWRIDGSSGSLDWERVSVSGTDSDSDAPRLRLPGPVVVQLDNDAAPEMILTIPTDANGRTNGNGARFVAMEMTSTDEIFQFRTPNGYSDSQPLPVDTDGDNIHDRLCWVTWYSESSVSFNRKGMAGCHDISTDPPIKEWSKDMQRGSGNDNDEIAVSPPIWMDINGDSDPELIVPFGKRLWAFDGEDGTSSEVSDGWSSPLGMPNRVWSAPAVADMDNDGTLDILIGDTLISQNIADFSPLSDNRGISFNPSQPDPGETVTVTGQFSNIGTLDNEDDLDVVIKQNGNEIARQRFTDVEPVAPTGNGGPYTFSVDIIAELGLHSFELIIDINGNLSEAREDNNHAIVELMVVEPYAAQIDIPSEIPRIAPGSTEMISVNLLATGSRTEDWTLSWDDSNLPSGWTISPDTNQDNNPNLIPGIGQSFVFTASVPQSALGDDNSYVILTLTLDSDTSITFDSILPIEVLRTRGLSITGPSGLDSTTGYGRPGHIATAWMMVENLGNAYETTTSIDWTAPSWGGTPTLHDQSGAEIFSLNLAPGEFAQLFVHLNTPSTVQPGSLTSTTMTMCIGSGDSTMCEDLSVNLTASEVTVQHIHQRTLPNTTLQWSVEWLIPIDGLLSWNTVSANMVHSNWIWSVDGDLSFNGSNIESSGSSGDAFSGNIYLELPVNAIPQRHYFTTTSSSESHHDLYFTLHVLQVYRSASTILQPIQTSPDTAVSMVVETTNQVLLRLENPGNGEDDFILSSEVIEGPNMSSPPVVELIEYNPERTLGALATTLATVDVILSEDTPAQEAFTLRFTWLSLGGDNVVSYVDLLVEAEPDHSWDLTLNSGEEYDISPDETLI
ncbi:MAG: FG-GAP-like repeat-containing protein, partial [Candidatus Thermoplasmatota archaeon]|nr:FG-GAP-like repeat-containing protein [Candidatus Thermoplasmatota archaeon]